jgi:hypothetical protein
MAAARHVGLRSPEIAARLRLATLALRVLVAPSQAAGVGRRCRDPSTVALMALMALMAHGGAVARSDVAAPQPRLSAVRRPPPAVRHAPSAVMTPVLRISGNAPSPNGVPPVPRNVDPRGTSNAQRPSS